MNVTQMVNANVKGDRNHDAIGWAIHLDGGSAVPGFDAGARLVNQHDGNDRATDISPTPQRLCLDWKNCFGKGPL
jgi:hypothetical protein